MILSWQFHFWLEGVDGMADTLAPMGIEPKKNMISKFKGPPVNRKNLTGIVTLII